MRRFLVSSGWIFATSLILVCVFMPFDPRLSERAQALPGAVVSFNRAVTDFGTFRWMLYSSGVLAIGVYIAARIFQARTYSGRLKAAWRLLTYFFLTIITASVLVHALKFLIGRARPELLLELGAYSLTPFTGDNLYESFPPGTLRPLAHFRGVRDADAPVSLGVPVVGACHRHFACHRWGALSKRCRCGAVARLVDGGCLRFYFCAIRKALSFRRQRLATAKNVPLPV